LRALSLFVLTKSKQIPPFSDAKTRQYLHAFISLHVRLITWVRFFATNYDILSGFHFALPKKKNQPSAW